MDRLNDKSEDENNESNKFIKFKNSKGRMFKFPYVGIKKWKVSNSSNILSLSISSFLVTSFFMIINFNLCSLTLL